jgi:hypothetical protein
MGKNALINGFYEEGIKIMPSYFFDKLMVFSSKRVLHLTHKNPDCDGAASIYWGMKIFKGDFFLYGSLTSSVRNLLKFLGMQDFKKEINFEDYDLFFIYDTEKIQTLSYIDISNREYVLFDHHPTVDDRIIFGAKLAYINVNSANVVNLFELSRTFHIPLDEKILFAFACGLFTDTGMLRTARKKELDYLANFISDRRLEDVMEVVYSKSLEESKEVLKRFSNCLIKDVNGLKVAVMSFKDKEEFFIFVDGLFKILDIDVLIGDIPEGTKIYLKKKYSQKIYNRTIIPFQRKFGLERNHGILLDFHESCKLLEEIKKSWKN